MERTASTFSPSKPTASIGTFRPPTSPPSSDATASLPKYFVQLRQEATEQLPWGYCGEPNLTWITDLIFQDLQNYAKKHPRTKLSMSNWTQQIFFSLSLLGTYGMSISDTYKVLTLGAPSALDEAQGMQCLERAKTGLKIWVQSSQRCVSPTLLKHCQALDSIANERPELLAKPLLRWTMPTNEVLAKRIRLRIDMVTFLVGQCAQWKSTAWLKKKDGWPKVRSMLQRRCRSIEKFDEDLRKSKEKSRSWSFVSFATDVRELDQFKSQCLEKMTTVSPARQGKGQRSNKASQANLQVTGMTIDTMLQGIKNDLLVFSRKADIASQPRMKRVLVNIPGITLPLYRALQEAYPKEVVQRCLANKSSALFRPALHVFAVRRIFEIAINELKQLAQLKKGRDKPHRIYEAIQVKWHTLLAGRVKSWDNEYNGSLSLDVEEALSHQALHTYVLASQILIIIIEGATDASFFLTKQEVEEKALQSAKHLIQLVDQEAQEAGSASTPKRRNRRRRRKKKKEIHQPIPSKLETQAKHEVVLKPLPIPTTTISPIDHLMQRLIGWNMASVPSQMGSFVEQKKKRLQFILARIQSAQKQSPSAQHAIRQLDGCRRLLENLSSFSVVTLGLTIDDEPLHLSRRFARKLPVHANHRLDFHYHLLQEVLPEPLAEIVENHQALFYRFALGNRQLWHRSQLSAQISRYEGEVGAGVQKLDAYIQILCRDEEKTSTSQQEAIQHCTKVTETGLSFANVFLTELQQIAAKKNYETKVRSNLTIDIPRLPVSRLAISDRGEEEIGKPTQENLQHTIPVPRQDLRSQHTMLTMRQLISLLSLLGDSSVLSPAYQGAERKVIRDDFLADARFTLQCAKNLIRESLDVSNPITDWELQLLFLRTLNLLHKAWLAQLPAYHRSNRHLLLTPAFSNSETTLGFCTHLGQLNERLRSCNLQFMSKNDRESVQKALRQMPQITSRDPCYNLYRYLNNPEHLSNYQGRDSLLLQLQQMWQQPDKLINEAQGFRYEKKEKGPKLDLRATLTHSLDLIRQLICHFPQPKATRTSLH